MLLIRHHIVPVLSCPQAIFQLDASPVNAVAPMGPEAGGVKRTRQASASIPVTVGMDICDNDTAAMPGTWLVGAAGRLAAGVTAPG